MGGFPQVAHGIQHTLRQRLACALKHDGEGHTKHIFVTELWRLVALHEPRHAPRPLGTAGGRALLHDGGQSQQGELPQGQQLAHGQSTDLKLAAGSAGAMALLETFPPDLLPRPFPAQHEWMTAMSSEPIFLGFSQFQTMGGRGNE